MRVLVVHNAYQQQGGEDAVVAHESAALRRSGCEVETFLVNNDDIVSTRSKIETWLHIVDGGKQIDRAIAKVKSFRPDVVHVHNHFPLISPSIHRAIHDLGVPTVQTFHNFRFGCASALLYRDGAVCTSCLSGSAYRAVLHACYRGSRLGSFAVARSIDHHRRAGTWSKHVDRIIALTDFARDVMIEDGLPADKIVVKPNGFADPGVSTEPRSRNMLYVGRLSEEKGVRVLAEAARKSGAKLTVVGDGPIAPLLQDQPNIDFRGWLSPEDVRREMATCAALVVPSLWYEGLPMVVVEAFATGTPVIASRLGSLTGLIEDEVDGVHVEAGDAPALAAAMDRLAGDPETTARLGAAARRKYERLWTEHATTSALLAVYSQAKASRAVSLAADAASASLGQPLIASAGRR